MGSDLEYYRCYQCLRGYADCTCPPAFTPEEREAIIASVLSSQLMAGLGVTRAEAERLFDELRVQPLPNPLQG
jgi:hypothetical protein